MRLPWWEIKYNSLFHWTIFKCHVPNGTHCQLISSHSNWTKNFPRFFHANVKLQLWFCWKGKWISQLIIQKSNGKFARIISTDWKALSTCVTSRSRFTDITQQIQRHHAQDSQTSRTRFQTSRIRLEEISLFRKKTEHRNRVLTLIEKVI